MHPTPTKDELVFACAIAVALFYLTKYGSAKLSKTQLAQSSVTKSGSAMPWISQAMAGYVLASLAWTVVGKLRVMRRGKSR